MKPPRLTDSEHVDAHIKKLEPALAEAVETLRHIILSADAEVGERVKWNNPNFYYTGPMPDFDPREHKRDIIVMNLFKGRLMLVFPSGAKVNDATGLLTGEYTDGRRIAVFNDLADINSKKEYSPGLDSIGGAVGCNESYNNIPFREWRTQGYAITRS